MTDDQCSHSIQIIQILLFRHARPCARHPRNRHRLCSSFVDGRDEPGHDE
jgi:hypothetical protein